MRVPTLRDLAALPYAHRLEPFTGEIEREGTYEWLHFDGSAFEDVQGGSTQFSESAFSSATFERGHYRRSRFDDVWMHTVRMVGTDLAETTWLDSECTASVFAGTEIHVSEMHRTVFHQCKFDSVNLRGSTLKDVAFVDCLLRDVDFGGAMLTGVSFPGSTLDVARFDKATVTRVDLSEALALGIASGIEALKGATISSIQLLDLAPALARHVGLTVKGG
ncbi:pentapeptide repeat-containing protein [Streptomyces sp. ZAF1911]|uniref:pentapeptide repeat-containing protein n=1 Tax=Streptomyces sp. ZAF1911 TaxID=2944129 RepID=UPI00237AB31A|nr:pentapeptide repeat-containing protein [Streptomyces sp. ZAF1911]MDD9376905.1 pentapeptide repeat-containing protein [Streptomyces sp. ZAF1911]